MVERFRTFSSPGAVSLPADITRHSVPVWGIRCRGGWRGAAFPAARRRHLLTSPRSSTCLRDPVDNSSSCNGVRDRTTAACPQPIRDRASIAFQSARRRSNHRSRSARTAQQTTSLMGLIPCTMQTVRFGAGQIATTIRMFYAGRVPSYLGPRRGLQQRPHRWVWHMAGSNSNLVG